MAAKLKCSNCGAEISTFNMSWSWKHLLIIVPFALLTMYPLARLYLFRGDISKDLVISEVEKRVRNGTLEVLGLITNNGSHDWSSVTVKVDFFDKSGAFLDQAEELLRADVGHGAKEHFKISILNPTDSMTSEESKMVVKIAGGHESPF